MFGSTLRGVGQDVDILIVGHAGEMLVRLKDEIAAAAQELPLHVLYMDPTEVFETNFIGREVCIPLSKLAFPIHSNDES